jgi:hypothetical protein
MNGIAGRAHPTPAGTFLRLADQGFGQRQIAASCTVGQATVSDYLTRSRGAGHCYEDLAHWLDEQSLAKLGDGHTGTAISLLVFALAEAGTAVTI